MLATHQKMIELGINSPFDDSWFQRLVEEPEAPRQPEAAGPRER